MTQAVLTGAIVTTSIVVAGAVAWLVTDGIPPGDLEPIAVGATAPIDVAHLRAEADPVSIEQGRVYYVQICLPCHGAGGDGRGEWAYRVTPRPANLKSVRTQRRSDDELFDLISEPVRGTPMIGWRKQLSDSQRRQVVAYVRHLGTSDGREIRH